MIKPKQIKVRDLKHFKDILSEERYEEDPAEFRMAMNGGVYSRKEIMLSDGIYLVTNCIDDSEQDLTEEQLFDEDYTLIGSAIKKGCLFFVDYGED